jgi:hypothetical protein
MGYGDTAPSEGDKRPRTFFVVQRRYKRARWVTTVLGALVAMAAIAWADGLVPDMGFYGGSAVLILAGTLAPWLIVGWLWHPARWQHFWEWQ